MHVRATGPQRGVSVRVERCLEAGGPSLAVDLAKEVAAMRRGEAPLPPYDRHMGFRLAGWGDGGAVLEVDVAPGHLNPGGVLHGGVVMGLADSAMGLTVSALLEPGQAGANADLQIRFLRPTTAGRLTATARVLRRGRSTVAMEADVTDAAGALVARASSLFMVRDARVPQGGPGP